MHLLSKIAIAIVCFNTLVFASQIDQSINVIEKTNKKLKSYQNKIDTLDSQKQNLVHEYKYVNIELKNNKSYNIQLQDIIKSQKEEIAELDEQIVEIEKTQKNIFPLMEDMIKSLKKLVELDTPFLLVERKARIEKLESMLNRADIKTNEKYRIILEAFKIEYDYSKNIETYQDNLDNKTFTFLRIGHVALYYQSLDFKEYGYWNKTSNSWDKIEDRTAQSNIRKGIKIAKKQQNVSLLELPFLSMKESK